MKRKKKNLETISLGLNKSAPAVIEEERVHGTPNIALEENL